MLCLAHAQQPTKHAAQLLWQLLLQLLQLLLLHWQLLAGPWLHCIAWLRVHAIHPKLSCWLLRHLWLHLRLLLELWLQQAALQGCCAQRTQAWPQLGLLLLPASWQEVEGVC
jgi:hypothetical protein